MEQSKIIDTLETYHTSSTSIRFLITNLISFQFTLFAICLSFSSPHFTKICHFMALFFVCRFIVRYVFVCILVCVVTMSQENTILCDFSNTNNNDFISTLIAPPATSAESCDINAALLNLVMKDQFSGSPNEDVVSHLNTFMELCDILKKRKCGQ